MNDELEELFEQVRTDRRQGSRELMTHLLEGLIDADDLPSDPESLTHLARRIADLRPGMALFENVAALLQPDAQTDSSLTPRHRLENLLEDHRQAVDELVKQYQRRGFSESSVLVFSRSGTLAEVLRILRPERVYVPESHPGSEGVSFAGSLSDTLEVTFLYDMEAGGIFSEVEALFLGCDRFGPEGTIHNKVGSHLLARAAGSTPVRVFTESWKYSPDASNQAGPTLASPDSLPASLRRQHPVLEPVPAKNIDSLITEQGVQFPSADPPPISGELRAARHEQRHP